MKPSILIVDDEESVRESFRLVLQDDYELAFAEDVRSALKILKARAFDLCLLDILLPDGSGLDLLRQVKRRDLNLDVIMVTALQGVETALDAMKLGAYDYITKPYKVDELRELVKRVLAKQSLERENRFLREELHRRRPAALFGDSRALQELRKGIEGVAKAELPVLLPVEPGSGSEEVAREIHARSLRGQGPFVTVACGSFAKGQMERELFGEEGNESRKVPPQIGKLEFADGGTLYLERVDRLPPEIQDRLHKALTAGRMSRLGSETVLPLDVRVVASCDREWAGSQKREGFRTEFLRWLASFILPIPPLRERPEDLPALIDLFLKAANQRARTPVKTIQRETLHYLIQYPWPGNLREMENGIEMMVLFSGKDTLTPEDIPLDILVKQVDLARTKEEARLSLKRVRRQFERQYIRKVLERTRGNQTRTAATLGLHRNTLIWKLKELDLEDDYKRIVRKRRDQKMGFRGL